MTVAGRFNETKRRLVAVLQVCLPPFSDHEVAYRWHLDHGRPIPSNCWVKPNPPRPYDQSNPPKDYPTVDKYSVWDRSYRERARQHGAFLVTRALFKSLSTPPPIEDEVLTSIFGKIPGTQNPRSISPQEFSTLMDRLGIDIPEWSSSFAMTLE